MIDSLYEALGEMDVIILANSLSVDIDVFAHLFDGCEFGYDSLSERSHNNNSGYQIF